MKIYVHLDGEETCTLICRVSDEAKVKALLEDVAQRYETKFGRKFAANEWLLQNGVKSTLSGTERVGRVLEDMEDVFLIPVRDSKEPKPPSAKTPPSKQQSVQPTPPQPTVNQNSPLMIEFIKRGEEEESQSRFRNASELYQRVFATLDMPVCDSEMVE